jgi:hypothetical protein
MHAPKLLRVVLFAAVVAAGLVGPTAFAAEQTAGPAAANLITDDEDKKNNPGRNDDKDKPDGKDDKGDGKDAKPDGKDDKGDKPNSGGDKPNSGDKPNNSDKPRTDDKSDKPGDAPKVNPLVPVKGTSAGDKPLDGKVDQTPKENGSKGGNAGAIFIKTGPTTGPGNEPHVGCEFYVSGMNFSSPSGTIAFYAWKPTGSFQSVSPVTGASTYTGGAPSKQAGGSNSDFLNGPYRLPTDGQTPHAQQGYHYKIDAINADGKKVDSKVFWVDCQATPGGSSVSQPAPTAIAGVGNTALSPTPVTTVAPPATATGGAPADATATPVAVPAAPADAGALQPVTATNAATPRPPTTTNAVAPQPATVASTPVTVVITMPITVNGPGGSVELPAGTAITVPAGTVLVSLPGPVAPARQFVEVERGTVLGTTAHGAVTSDDEAIGEVVLGEQMSAAASVLPTALPRTGGAPLGAAAALAASLTLAGIAVRRRSVR